MIMIEVLIWLNQHRDHDRGLDAGTGSKSAPCMVTLIESVPGTSWPASPGLLIGGTHPGDTVTMIKVLIWQPAPGH